MKLEVVNFDKGKPYCNLRIAFGAYEFQFMVHTDELTDVMRRVLEQKDEILDSLIKIRETLAKDDK